VPSLELPEPGAGVSVEDVSRCEAIRLFVERARLVVPGFELTDRNVSAVVQTCCRLDGVASAIELAAARMAVLSAEQIAARLVVAITTVKTHVNGIFRKLDAASRIEAVKRARELGLLGRAGGSAATQAISA